MTPRSLTLPLWLLCAGLVTAALPAAEAPSLLWPGAAPGDGAPPAPEADTTRPTDNQVAGKRVIRLGQVYAPSLTVYPAPVEKRTGTMVLVCPGGGYNILAMDLEGTEVCEWLNTLGVSAAVLKYRVPARPGRERYAAALQDAQRAIGLLRSRCGEWGVRPDRIGVLGFSAGGHLAATLCNTEKRTYDRVDAADDGAVRPNFALLIYPAYLTQKDQGDRLSPELTVGAATPPTFLAMTQDDPVRVESAIHYYVALKNARVPAELHVYPEGGHGYGLRPSKHVVSSWPLRAAEWLKSRGLVQAP